MTGFKPLPAFQAQEHKCHSLLFVKIITFRQPLRVILNNTCHTLVNDAGVDIHRYISLLIRGSTAPCAFLPDCTKLT
jgi:hypothetical protein